MRGLRELIHSVEDVASEIPDVRYRPGRRHLRRLRERELLNPIRSEPIGHRVAFWLVAIALHGIAFAVTFPEPTPEPLEEPIPVRIVHQLQRYTPPPIPSQREEPKGRRILEKIATIEEPDPPPPDEPPAPVVPRSEPVHPRPAPVDYEIEPEPIEVPRLLIAGIDGVTVPELLERVEPDYPPTARRARIGARVVLRAVILKDGTVDELSLISGPDNGLGFEEAAERAVRRWVYRPATQDGRPVDVTMTVVVTFSR